MKRLKLIISIVLVLSILMSMSACTVSTENDIKHYLGLAHDKENCALCQVAPSPKPSVSEKPTETDKPTTPEQPKMASVEFMLANDFDFEGCVFEFKDGEYIGLTLAELKSYPSQKPIGTKYKIVNDNNYDFVVSHNFNAVALPAEIVLEDGQNQIDLIKSLKPEPTTPSPEPTTPEVKTYIVEFDSNVTAKVGGTAIVSGDKVKSGSTVIFTAKVVEGKEFIKFWNNGTAISGSNPCTYTVTADMYVSPEYGVQHKLTFDEGISVINNVTGKSITSGDFIRAKTSITVKANVPEGKSFVKFFTKSALGTILSHTSNPSTFNSYDFDSHISVEFKDISFTYILQLGQMHENHNISVNGQKIAFYEYEYPYPKASSGDLIRFDYLDSDMLYIFLEFYDTNNYSGKHFITKQITRSEALSNGFSLPYPSYFSPEAFLYLNDIILSGGSIQVMVHGTYIKE